MKTYVSENNLVAAIRERFPVEAEITDQWLIERGWDPTDQDGTAYTWVEAFADRTTDAIKRRDSTDVQAQSDFVAEHYLASPEALRAIVDVSYAENIMWDASYDDKVWAWQYIAPEIRKLYEAFGKIPRSR